MAESQHRCGGGSAFMALGFRYRDIIDSVRRWLECVKYNWTLDPHTVLTNSRNEYLSLRTRNNWGCLSSGRDEIPTTGAWNSTTHGATVLHLASADHFSSYLRMTVDSILVTIVELRLIWRLDYSINDTNCTVRRSLERENVSVSVKNQLDQIGHLGQTKSRYPYADKRRHLLNCMQSVPDKGWYIITVPCRWRFILRYRKRQAQLVIV